MSTVVYSWGSCSSLRVESGRTHKFDWSFGILFPLIYVAEQCVEMLSVILIVSLLPLSTLAYVPSFVS